MRPDYPILDPLSSPRKPWGLCALAVMAKVPRPGAVKTRLVPPLTYDEAAALNTCFLQDTALNIAGLSATGACEGIIAYTPVGAESLFNGLLPEGFSLLPQRGESFGDRLFHVAEDLLALGYESLCLIDSDSPTLPSGILGAAVASLARGHDEVVLGAADDGGYYLIGCTRAHRHMFTDVQWSTGQVLAQTIQRAAELQVPVELLPTWYDVDDAHSLVRLTEELLEASHRVSDEALAPYHAPHTRLYLSRLLQTKSVEHLLSPAQMG